MKSLIPMIAVILVTVFLGVVMVFGAEAFNKQSDKACRESGGQVLALPSQLFHGCIGSGK